MGKNAQALFSIVLPVLVVQDMRYCMGMDLFTPQGLPNRSPPALLLCDGSDEEGDPTMIYVDTKQRT